MTTEQLKAKLQKREEELKDLRKQVKDAELAEQKAAEEAAKLEALSPQVSQAIQDVLNKSGLTLPVGKQIVTIVGDTGLSTSIINGKVIRTSAGKGNGGAKAITYEGKQTSWAGLCELKGIARTPGGSAHRDVYNKARELHDSIQHECSVDGKVYPIS